MSSVESSVPRNESADLSNNEATRVSSSASATVSSAQSASSRQTRRTRKSSTAFRTISEVADELGVQQHVLRFWETKFSQVKPLKRGGGRRYYRPEDIDLLKQIHTLLYKEGYTIKGVQKLLREKGKNEVLNGAGQSLTAGVSRSSASGGPGLSPEQKDALQTTLGELRALRRMIVG